MRRPFYLFLFPLVIATAVNAADPVEFTVGNFVFARPENWGWVVPTSPMRKAQLSVPASDGGPPAEVTFFHFGAGQGGTVQANVDRWFKQFSGGGTDAASERVGKATVTFVKAFGTFSSGMPGGPATPLKGYALRGAILESPEGDVYVKMTGPEAVVKLAESAFEKMIRQAASR
ncbi:MAG TPA: hypothetical protein VIS96_06200 [Terrimicrobiaceae bacterium]